LSHILGCLGISVFVLALGKMPKSEENLNQLANEANRGFTVRASKVAGRIGKPVLLELTLVYTGDKPLRIDNPINGLCQPGNSQPPWVWIKAPAGWEDRPEAYRDAFPEQSNSFHSTAVTIKRGDQFTAIIPLHRRFRIPRGRSTIQVTWPIFGDTFAPDWSSKPLATPTVMVPVELAP
jgi:hypothetical protein